MLCKPSLYPHLPAHTSATHQTTPSRLIERNAGAKKITVFWSEVNIGFEKFKRIPALAAIARPGRDIALY
jgi:hypothetical protein